LLTTRQPQRLARGGPKAGRGRPCLAGHHEKWLELKGIDVYEWAFKQTALEDLLEQASGVGGFRARNCANIDEDGYCTWWTYGGYYRKANRLRCAFCDGFEDAR
jgi:hypothetical protein